MQVSDIGLALGRKSTSGLGRAVEVLDNLSSSMTSLSPGGDFVSATTTKGNKISIIDRIMFVTYHVQNYRGHVGGPNLTDSLSERLDFKNVSHEAFKDVKKNST